MRVIQHSVAAALLVILPQAVRAGDAGVVDDLAACRKLTDAAERLACFDAASNALLDAQAKQNVIVLDRETVKKKKKEDFGLAAGETNLFRDKSKELDVKLVTGRIAMVKNSGIGRYLIVLEDGAVWRTQDTIPVGEPEQGDSIRIAKGALGSYRAKIGNRFLVNVERVR